MDIKWEEVGRHNDRECTIVHVEGLDKAGNRFQASADVWEWEEAKVIDPTTVQKICLTCDEEMTDNRFSMCRKCLEHNHSGGGNF
jgi:hypothetical protein